MKHAAQYSNVINTFSTKRILVIGDLLLDIYLTGRSTRLCPEAPVPVVDIQERTAHPGGAANTVCNLKALGASVIFCSAIGCDPEGDEAIRLLQELQIPCGSIARDSGRQTITKSRVVSGSQVITRIDRGSNEPVSEETTRWLSAEIERAYPFCDGIVISDYNKGLITDALLDTLISLQARDPKFVAVDSKRLTFFRRLRPTQVKPNYEEAVSLVGLTSRSTERVHQVLHCSKLLYEKLAADLVTVTLDSEGCVIIEKGRPAEITKAPKVIAPHVAGAGDTWLSGFVLAYLSTQSNRISARIGSAAANIAIRKEGTSACSQAELKSYFNIHTKYISDFHDLGDICDAYHKAGKRIVFTNGCFDILHSGHVTYLHRARELGDILIVGLNTDESIKRIKGNNRPINCMSDRLKVLAGLSSVDHIVCFGDESDDTPIPLIRLVRPHVFAKGGDYAAEQLPEAEAVLAYGGEIVFIDHVPDHSTTLIINRISQASKNNERRFYEQPLQ
jgi:D-beta-D-heptose 7-phosphate kinase / D-beta-D-heptose 1-phosphate adenosyltransferase